MSRKMKRFFLYLFFFGAMVFLCGCINEFTYCRMHIPKYDLPAPSPVKFYVSSLRGRFLIQDEAQKIVNALPEKYPDFFTADQAKGIPVDLRWNYDTRKFAAVKLGNYVLHAVTLGLVPCVNTTTKYFILTAECPKIQPGKGKLPAGSVAYSADEDFLSISITAPLGYISYPGYEASHYTSDDLFSGHFADYMTIHRTPFRHAAVNMPLFPAACLKMFNSLTAEHKKFLLSSSLQKK